jgi:hypothetical protein
VKVLLPAEKAEAIDEADKTEVMIAMKMRDKNMRDLAAPYSVIDHLYLRAFATVYEKIIAVHRHYLAGGVPVKSGHSRVISKNGDCEHAQSLVCDIRLIGLILMINGCFNG